MTVPDVYAASRAASTIRPRCRTVETGGDGEPGKSAVVGAGRRRVHRPLLVEGQASAELLRQTPRRSCSRAGRPTPRNPRFAPGQGQATPFLTRTGPRPLRFVS
jgi:hypothetical protein